MNVQYLSAVNRCEYYQQTTLSNPKQFNSEKQITW